MYWELVVTVLLKNDIKMIDVQEQISKYLNHSMSHDSFLLNRHMERRNKLYVFSGLYPVDSKTKVFRNGAVYVFRIRSLDQKFINHLEATLRISKHNMFQYLSVEKRFYPNRLIESIYTLTPVIVTVDNRPWLKDTNDIDILIDRLQANADKKYHDAFNKRINNIDFIQSIEILNEKPLAISYKNIKLLGNKLRLTINTDENSQKLANIVLGAGLGEKGSSLGAGFCFANFI